jgi:hypothetical protein
VNRWTANRVSSNVLGDADRFAFPAEIARWPPHPKDRDSGSRHRSGCYNGSGGEVALGPGWGKADVRSRELSPGPAVRPLPRFRAVVPHHGGIAEPCVSRVGPLRCVRQPRASTPPTIPLGPSNDRSPVAARGFGPASRRSKVRR